MGAHSYHVVLNANAGTASIAGVTADQLQAMFEANGMVAQIDADTDQTMADRVARAVAGPADIVVAAGGDGTITALAAALVDSDKSLAILPLGTVNALAKDLKIPLDLATAVASLATSTPQRIDVGEVNGRIFLHKVVVGFIPGLAAGRERIRGNQTTAAKLGLLRYFFRRLARARRIAVAIDADAGAVQAVRVQAIAVASNAYDEGFGQFFSRENLDRGTLTLYVLKHFSFADFVRLTGGMLLGRWRDDHALRVESVKSVTIRSHKTLCKAMFDGEVQTLSTPLVFRIRPLALSILTPVAPASAQGGDLAEAKA
ncbi:diacylglycerol/lipid kinase family protein [uncultured Devosia sp.]|uniref:diacylglycerol/lipid kinase family protein n=1 Tax=uncultured Devosia sp. TaxID=211434 RepID=UPI0035CA30AA